MRLLLWIMLSLLAVPSARAQPDGSRAIPLVAVFMGGTVESHRGFYDEFRRGMAEAGWREGVNVRYEVRWGNGRLESFAPLAQELADLRPNVIVAGTSPGAIAVAKAAKGRIPVVTVSDDPVTLGLAASHARPGGNVTGISPMFLELSLKQVEVLQRIRPGSKRIAILVNSADAVTMKRFTDIRPQMSAKTQLIVVDARSAQEIPAALQKAVREKADGLIVPVTILFNVQRATIARIALEERLATVFAIREAIEEGGLISYGIDLGKQYARTAHFADRILKGASPAALPIEFFRDLEMAVNLRTAASLGVAIPEDILLRAVVVQ